MFSLQRYEIYYIMLYKTHYSMLIGGTKGKERESSRRFTEQEEESRQLQE